MVKRVAIVGIVGLPANYGGFETLAENLIGFTQVRNSEIEYEVFCSKGSYHSWPTTYRGARLLYLPLRANGYQSVLFDFLSLSWAFARSADVVLVLGVSGGVFFPLIKLLSSSKLIVNVDGIEWRREKWGFFQRRFLKFSERIAALYADVVVADNAGISNYIRQEYGVDAVTIAYGGDHALVDPFWKESVDLPEEFFLSVCRIEPENNVELILEAFSLLGESLVFVGNWSRSEYGDRLRIKYAEFPNILLLDPIYDLNSLAYLRSNCLGYIHGHSAGGTNPSLVEMMQFDKCVFAFDCNFNRFTTNELARYFNDVESLCHIVSRMRASNGLSKCGELLGSFGRMRYSWKSVAGSYVDLFD